MSESIEVTLKDVVNATQMGSFMHTSPEFHTPLLEQGLVEINVTMTNEDGDVATRATQAGIDFVNQDSSFGGKPWGGAALAEEQAQPSGTEESSAKIPVPEKKTRGRKSQSKSVDVVKVSEEETKVVVSGEGSGETQLNLEIVANEISGNISLPSFVGTNLPIAANVPMPSIKGRGRSGVSYPFEQLELNHSFFIPNSEEKPNVAKSLASTISGVNARYSKLTGGVTNHPVSGVEIAERVYERKFVIRAVADGAAWGEQFKGVAGAGVWRVI